jgi:hypothetical protein
MTKPTDYPTEVRDALTELIGSLDQCLGVGYSLATYAGLAQRRFPIERRLVNVALVVEKLSEEVLRSLREPMSIALRRCHLDVFMIEYAQLSRVADSFAVKLSEIQKRHEMLRGPDPFADLVINPEFVRLRLEQESRNHLMRLRRSYLLGGDSTESLAQAIRKSVSFLLDECDSIFALQGLAAPADLAAFVEMVAERMGVQLESLKELVEFRGLGTLERMQALYFELLRLVEQVVLFVDELEHKV